MSAYVDSAAIGNAEDVTDSTTAAVTTTGSDKVFIGGSVAGGFFPGAIDTSEMRYGGSGGTLLSQQGTDQTFNNTLGIVNAWGVIDPAASSQTAYAAFAAAAQASAIVGACYSGVDQTTPFSSTQVANSFDSSGTNAFIDCSLAATGLTVGRTLVAIIGAFSTGVDATSFTALSGQGTLRDHAISTLAIIGVALVEKVVASTSETIGARFNIGAAGAGLDYVVIAFELIEPAGGGGGGVTLMGQKIFVRA